jgi:MFS family permease
MGKRTITQWWVVGMIVMAVGAILSIFSALALAAHIPVQTGDYQPDYVPDSIFWMLVSLIVLGGIAVLAGIVVQIVAWVAALFNTNRLADKTWFTVLLVCGIAGIVLGPLFGLGALCWWGAMIGYLVGGPDGMAAGSPQLREMPSVPPRTLAPTG